MRYLIAPQTFACYMNVIIWLAIIGVAAILFSLAFLVFKLADKIWSMLING